MQSFRRTIQREQRQFLHKCKVTKKQSINLKEDQPKETPAGTFPAKAYKIKRTRLYCYLPTLLTLASIILSSNR